MGESFKAGQGKVYAETAIRGAVSRITWMMRHAPEPEDLFWNPHGLWQLDAV